MNTVYVIEEVVSTRCLGVQIDNALKWDHHVSELAKSFTQKLNLLKSLNTIQSAIPQRQTNEWCRITCRPGLANYLKYKILTAD